MHHVVNGDVGPHPLATWRGRRSQLRLCILPFGRYLNRLRRRCAVEEMIAMDLRSLMILPLRLLLILLCSGELLPPRGYLFPYAVRNSDFCPTGACFAG